MADQLIGNAVIMPVDLDVIIDVGANAFPLGYLIAFPGQRLQCRPVQFGEQRGPRAVPFSKAAMIQALEQLCNRLVDLGHRRESLMAESGDNPALDNRTPTSTFALS